jgi:hypothetical protein
MPPPASALAVANDFKADLLDCGVPQVSIEMMIGRSGRWVSTGSHGGTSFVANLGHHIASNPSASNPTPGLSVVKNGRPGIPAPLSNCYGGMDLIARIICLDWANHPGEGGPWTIDGFRIPRDGGRPYLLGWEHEGGFSTAVWDATYTNRATGKRMTYREFMGRCHAGTLRFLSRPRTSHGEHSTWADLKQIGRKIDRLGYGHPVGTAATKGINELTPYYLGATEDDVSVADVRQGVMEILNEAYEASTLPVDQRTKTGMAARKYIRTILLGVDNHVQNAVLNTDGIVKAPPSAATAAENPFWSLASHVTSTTEAARYTVPRRLDQLEAKIDAALALAAGVELDQVLQRIDQVATSATLERAALADRLDLVDDVVVAAVREELRDVSGVDEDEIAARVLARFGALFPSEPA